MINPDDLILQIKMLGMSNQRRDLQYCVESYQDSVARAPAAGPSRRFASLTKDGIDPAGTIDPDGPSSLWTIAAYSAAMVFGLAFWVFVLWLCLEKW